MALRFNGEAFRTLIRRDMSATDLQRILHREGISAALQSVRNWEKGVNEPRASSLLILLRERGSDRISEAAETIIRAFFTEG